MNSQLRVAVSLGGAATGMGILMLVAAAWGLTTPWNLAWLLIAIMAGGTWCVGAYATFRYVLCVCRRRNADTRVDAFLAIGVVVFYSVLLSAGYWAAHRIPSLQSRYVVVISNEAAEPLKDVRVQAGLHEHPVGDIGPGGERKVCVPIESDGDLSLVGSFRGREVTVVCDGYVTCGYGGRTRVVLTSAGRLVVGW